MSRETRSLLVKPGRLSSPHLPVQAHRLFAIKPAIWQLSLPMTVLVVGIVPRGWRLKGGLMIVSRR